MADYSGSYANSMDRSSGENIPSIGGGPKPEPLLAIHEIGISIMATRDVIQPLIAKIREGARKVEIGFMGSGKGSIFSGQITPEGVDAEQRRAIRELAKVNQMELSTHASVGIQGFAGLTNRGFDEGSREQTLHELKRAIDFAAEASGGGAITMHSGEFQRPLYNIDEKGSEKYNMKFQLFPGEHAMKDKDGKMIPGKATHMIADEKTGQIQAIPEDITIQLPVYEKDKQGKIIKDNFGNPVPAYDTQSQKAYPDERAKWKFATREIGWDDVKKEQEQWNKENPNKKIGSPEQMFIKLQNDAKIQQIEGQRLYYLKDLDHYEQEQAELKEAETKVKQLNEKMSQARTDQEREQLAIAAARQGLAPEMADQIANGQGDRVLRRINNQINNFDQRIASIMQTAISYQEQQQDLEKQTARFKPVADIALDKTFDTIGKAGFYAFEKAKQQGLKRDLFVAPENLFPETFGSHPDELKSIIMNSRKKMADMLVQQKNMSPSEANEQAQKSIRATFDIGHANMWRKYMETKPGESIEDQGKRFKGWLIGKLKELNKEKIIGHIHVTDNFGYNDEHLTPGAGNAPILEFVKTMTEAGVTDLIVEPGAQDPAKQYEAMYGGWKLFGNSIYGLAAPGKAPVGWDVADTTYFGSTSPPRFLFGEMALSDQYRGKPFYTGLGLE